MINKYKNAEGVLKEYKATKVKTGTAKNGEQYTCCQITDAKQVNGSWVYDNYIVFSWQEGLDLQDNDKIQLEDIQAIDVKESEYNGKKIISKTIFANINVIFGEGHTPKQPEVVGGELDELDDLSDGLPF